MHLAEQQSTGASSVLYAATRPQGRRFTAEDLWKIQRVQSGAPSHDGRAIVVPVTSYDLEQNTGRTRLWLVPTGDGEPRALTA